MGLLRRVCGVPPAYCPAVSRKLYWQPLRRRCENRSRERRTVPRTWRGSRRVVPHGLRDFYPDEAPVREVDVDGFWMDERAGDGRRIPPLRPRDRLRHARREAPTAEEYPDADPELLVPARSSSAHAGPVPLNDFRNWWESARRVLETAGRARHDDQRARPPSRRPCRLRGRAGVRGLGRQGAPHRGRVGVRGARGARRRGLRLGRRGVPRGQADGELLAGRVPLAEPEDRRLRRDVAGRLVPAERLRALRRLRERLGVDVGFFGRRRPRSPRAARRRGRPPRTSRGA